MRGFAFPVPLQIIADRLGIPAEEREFFEDAAAAAAAHCDWCRNRPTRWCGAHNSRSICNGCWFVWWKTAAANRATT